MLDCIGQFCISIFQNLCQHELLHIHAGVQGLALDSLKALGGENPVSKPPKVTLIGAQNFPARSRFLGQEVRPLPIYRLSAAQKGQG